MKIGWLIFFLFCISHSLFSQDKEKIDSLFYELSIATDTTKVALLNNIASQYADNNPDSSIKYLEISLKNAELLKYENGIAEAYGLLGNCYSITGDYALSEDYYNKSINLYQKLGNKAKTANFQILKAYLHIVQGNYIDAFLILNKVKEDANDKIEARVNHSIAYTYHELENFEEALKYIHLALKYYEKVGNISQIANSNNFIGSIYYQLNDNDMALKYYNNSLKLSEDYPKDKDYAFVIGNIGLIKDQEKKYDEAIELFQKAALILTRPSDKMALANIYNNLADTYYSINDYAKSEEYFNKAKNIYLELNDERSVALCLLGLANLQKESNPKQALISYLKSAELAEKYNYLSFQREIYLALSEFYETQQNYISSLNYHKKYLVVKDSIFNVEKEKAINNITISYEVEKKDSQIQSLQNENKLREKTIEGQKQKFALLIILLTIIILFTVIFSYLLISKNNVLRQLVKKDKEVLHAEEKLGKNIKKINDLKETNNSNEKSIATQILKLMEEDKVFIQNDLSVSMFATYCNTNPKYISQTINSVFGQKFNSFINEYRIKYACRLLMQEKYKSYTISAISKEVGFNSISTFISSFKKNTGVTPSYYIRNLNK